MDAREAICRLHRRFGFGLAPGQLDDAMARGVIAEADRLVDPDGHDVPAAPDAWPDPAPGGTDRPSPEAVAGLVDAWLTALVASPRPMLDRLAWFWHGHFTSSIAKVRSLRAMVDQIRLLQRSAAGPFPALLRAVTVDPAMLVYLDGRASTGDAPNENYSREVLELFALGRGNGYTEDDVHHGAIALTGWTVRPADPTSALFVPRRHDDRPQPYLGTTVHDMDTVVDAITARPEAARWVAGRLGREVLGPGIDDDVAARLATAFAASGLSIRALARAVVDELLAGTDGGPVVTAPVPWLVMAQRATGATLDAKQRAGVLRAMGQVPFAPPNVGGWPGGRAWLSSATMVSRFDAAALVAARTPADQPAQQAASAGDLDALARALGLPRPFGADTSAQVVSVANPTGRLCLALTSPEFVLA